jgi:thiol:disulfide interchange protein DsbC
LSLLPEIPRGDEKGIEERRDIAFSIFLFPLKSHKDAYWKSKSIVCHKSLKMLEDAFAHKEIPKPECDTKEIDNNINLGNSIGIRGTPTVIFPDGRMQVGAVAARELIELLREKR